MHEEHILTNLSLSSQRDTFSLAVNSTNVIASNYDSFSQSSTERWTLIFLRGPHWILDYKPVYYFHEVLIGLYVCDLFLGWTRITTGRLSGKNGLTSFI